jgi:hypothetical protein
MRRMQTMSDPLKREYGVLLGVAGPILLQRADDFTRLADLVGPGKARDYLLAQADRAYQTITTIGRRFNELA